VRVTAGLARARGGAVFFGYWLTGVAFVAQFVSSGVVNYAAGPFLKPMTVELGWTRSQYALALTVGQFVTAFAGLGIGAYVDRRGGRLPMRLGTAAMAAALLGLSFVQELWQWVLLHGVLLTAGAALTGGLVVNVTLAKWFVSRRGRVLSIASMGVSTAGIVIPPLLTPLIDEAGWREAWRVLALATLVVVLPLTFLMRRAPEDHGLHPDGMSAAEAQRAGGRAAQELAASLTRQQALRTRAFYLIVFAFGLAGLAIGVILIQTIPFMTDAGYSRSTASFMIVLTSIPSLVTKPLWGLAVDRADARHLTIVGFCANAAALLLIVWSVSAHADALVYAGFFLLGIGWGGFIPLQEVIWASFFGRRHLGAVRSAGLPFSLVLGAGGPLVVAAYFDIVGDYNGAFLAIAVCQLLGVALLLLARRPQHAVAAAT
jgi:MFS family permease